MKRKIAAAVLAGALAAAAATAFGDNPNQSGNSGHFNPNSGPCQGSNDQPNCPGPNH